MTTSGKEIEQRDQELAPTVQHKPKRIKTLELPATPYNTFQESILNDINTIKECINEYTTLGTQMKPVMKCTSNVVVNNRIFQLNIPVFNYILHNPNGTSIPTQLLNEYVGETNYSAQTPLMLATIINNLNYVKQLITYDIGKIDEYDKSALDYAYEFSVQPDIIDLLEQYEYGY